MRAKPLIVTSTLISGLLVGAAAPVAAEPAPNWGGFYVDGALGFRNTQYKVTNFTQYSESYTLGGTYSTANSGSSDLGSSNFLGQISAGWRWAPGPVVVGIGLFADLASANKASTTFNSSWSNSPTGTSGFTYSTIQVKEKNRYGLSLDVGPNWRTSPYAKFAANWADYSVSTAADSCGMAGTTAATGNSFTNHQNGFGVGAGIRHLQTDNLYFFAEIMWTGMGSKTKTVSGGCVPNANAVALGVVNQNRSQQVKISPTDYTGVIGVGWKF
ncbi:outer membrane beta-barrel protein [uncultured Thiodictyon sp.]|uniref:outer membrane protein n=1 Tax=uncultured Thiodictyon sp. TaxID=1846217 RepID=UPI0025F7D19B|nr:outer membrane beta-barrel protein [uncultured Thiodictyon sp.]